MRQDKLLEMYNKDQKKEAKVLITALVNGITYGGIPALVIYLPTHNIDTSYVGFAVGVCVSVLDPFNLYDKIYRKLWKE
jgi:hypothetical protein